MTEGQLADVLFAAAVHAATMRNLRFGDGADSDIRRFAISAAERVFKEYPSGPPAAVIDDSKEAFEKLVEEMARAASEIPDYMLQNPGVVGEQTLARAMSRLCPLFPIC